MTICYVDPNGIVKVRAFHYETPDRRFNCFILHRDKKNEEDGYDFIQFDYRIKLQDVDGKIFSLTSRIGGPAFYRLVDGEIMDIEYRINGVRINPGAYWVKVCTQLIKHFEAVWRNEVVYFKSKSGQLPCP